MSSGFSSVRSEVSFRPSDQAFDLVDTVWFGVHAANISIQLQEVAVAIGWDEIVGGRFRKGRVLKEFDRTRPLVISSNSRSLECVSSLELDVFGSAALLPGSLLNVNWASGDKSVGFARNPRRSRPGWSTTVDIVGFRSILCRAKTLDVAWPDGSKQWAEVIDIGSLGAGGHERDILTRVGSGCCLTLSLPRCIQIGGTRMVRSSVLMQKGKIALCAWSVD